MKLSALIAILAVLSACSKAPPGDPGRAYYEQLNCKACHRIGEEGGLGGPDLTMVGFRRSPQWLDVWMKDPQAWRPGTTMPNPGVNDRTRAALVSYLSGLKGQAFAGRAPWNAPELAGKPVARGLALYGRAGCIACHGKEGRGGYPNNNVKGGAIPGLATVAQTYTKADLAKKIKNGVAPEKADPAGPAPLVSMPKWGDALKDDEIAAVVEYLFSLKPGSASGPDF